MPKHDSILNQSYLGTGNFQEQSGIHRLRAQRAGGTQVSSRARSQRRPPAPTTAHPDTGSCV